jgi:hypothetical protein
VLLHISPEDAAQPGSELSCYVKNEDDGESPRVQNDKTVSLGQLTAQLISKEKNIYEHTLLV